MNIEQDFLIFNPLDDSFPHNNSSRNYISLYNILKGKFDTEIHPEIKTKILEIEKSGYFNDHGIDHIKMVVDRVSRLIKILSPVYSDKENGFFLSPYELFILLMAINLHDAGHLIASRDDHARKGKELLARFDGGLLTPAERKIIGDIAKAHGGKNDPIGQLQEKHSISHKKIRPQLLAALLRLGDELAEDKTRASQLLLKLKSQNKDTDIVAPIEPTSEIFHRFSASLDSIDLDSKEITLFFYVYEEQLRQQFPKATKDGIKKQFLIDEIYERAVKTFTEMLYCNRYFPPDLRFNSVKIEIHLLTEFDEEIFTPIKFILKESGYPSLKSIDIFDLCKTELKTTDGVNMDGLYFSKIIENNE